MEHIPAMGCVHCARQSGNRFSPFAHPSQLLFAFCCDSLPLQTSVPCSSVFVVGHRSLLPFPSFQPTSASPTLSVTLVATDSRSRFPFPATSHPPVRARVLHHLSSSTLAIFDDCSPCPSDMYGRALARSRTAESLAAMMRRGRVDGSLGCIWVTANNRLRKLLC